MLLLYLRWKIFFLNFSVFFVPWSNPISACYLSVTVVPSGLKTILPISLWASRSLLRRLRVAWRLLLLPRFAGKGKPMPGFRSQPFHHPCKHKSCKLHHLQHIQYPRVSNHPFSRPASSSTWKVPHFFHPCSCFVFLLVVQVNKETHRSVITARTAVCTPQTGVCSTVLCNKWCVWQ